MIGNAQNKLDIFRVVDTGTAYAIYDALAGTVAASDNTDKLIRLSLLEEAPFQYQEDGTLQCDFTQLQDDDALNALLNVLAKPPVGSATRPEVVLQDGTKQGGDGGTDLVLIIYYGGLDDGKIKTTVALGKLAPTSGSHTDKYNDWSKPSFSFVGVLAAYTLTIASALADATILDATAFGTAVPSILKGECFKRLFITDAA